MREDKNKLADDILFPRVPKEEEIKLLIGSDQSWKLVTGEILRSEEIPGLVALYIKMAQHLQGPVGQPNLLSGRSQVMVCMLRASGRIEEESMAATLPSFWDLNSM